MTSEVYQIDLVFPVDIVTQGDMAITINSYDELEDVIEDCFGI